MAKTSRASPGRSNALLNWLLRWCFIGMMVVMAACANVHAQGPGEPAAAAAAAAPASAAATAQKERVVLRWQRVPRVFGRVEANSLGVVINTLDPYSVEVGEYYIQRRQIPARHVLRVEMPVQARLSAAEFEQLKRRIEEHFGPEVQALALVWTQPYAVACNAITGALALGFDASLCSQTCARTRLSPYFNSASSAPFKDHGMRPAMLLASATAAQARQLIDRGIAADHTLGLRGALPVHAYYLATSDRARSVRVPLFPPPGLVASKGVVVHVERRDAPRDLSGLLLMETGTAQLSGLDALHWVPGALADHLTSFGGVLDSGGGQTNALAWLASGATASYGTVSEPCNHPQKFPHPQLLLLHYLQGSSALEAYWKSVAWPQQGVFVGEPLAAPFAQR